MHDVFIRDVILSGDAARRHASMAARRRSKVVKYIFSKRTDVLESPFQ